MQDEAVGRTVGPPRPVWNDREWTVRYEKHKNEDRDRTAERDFKTTVAEYPIYGWANRANDPSANQELHPEINLACWDPDLSLKGIFDSPEQRLDFAPPSWSDRFVLGADGDLSGGMQFQTKRRTYLLNLQPVPYGTGKRGLIVIISTV